MDELTRQARKEQEKTTREKDRLQVRVPTVPLEDTSID